jgi:hypothetical protein
MIFEILNKEDINLIIFSLKLRPDLSIQELHNTTKREFFGSGVRVCVF